MGRVREQGGAIARVGQGFRSSDCTQGGQRGWGSPWNRGRGSTGSMRPPLVPELVSPMTQGRLWKGWWQGKEGGLDSG